MAKARQRRHCREGASSAGARVAVGRITSAILRSIDGLASSSGPLDAEVAASRAIGILELDPSARLEDRMALVERLLDALGGRRTPDALALAMGFRALLPGKWRSMADATVARLLAKGVTPPVWADDVGGSSFEAAWAWTDEFGDQDLIVAAFRHPGRDAHAIRLMADHNFNGLFRQAAVDPDPDLTRRVWFETTGARLRPITARDLAARWAAGTGWYRRYLGAPVYEDVPPLMALLEARAATLPTPLEPPEPEPMPDDERLALIDRFLASPVAISAGLDAAPDGRHAVLVEHLIGFRENHGEGDALRWSPVVTEIALLDWLPRKVLLDEDDVDALPRVLRAFVMFAAREKDLAAEDLAETLAAIDEFEPQFRGAMADDEQASPAKALVRQMLAEGVDLQDPEAQQRWIAEFNARSFEERNDLLRRMN